MHEKNMRMHEKRIRRDIALKRGEFWRGVERRTETMLQSSLVNIVKSIQI
jgi:hypothetical protein